MSGLKTNESKITFVNLKQDKETEKMSFVKQENDGGKWIAGEKFTGISGKLINFGFSTFEYKGEEIDKIELFFDCDGEIIKIESGFHAVSRSLINSLCGAENAIKNGHEIEISLYQKDGYNRVAVKEPDTFDKEKMYGWETTEFPKPTEKKVGKKTIVDYSEVNEFFKELAKEKLMPAFEKMPFEA